MLDHIIRELERSQAAIEEVILRGDAKDYAEYRYQCGKLFAITQMKSYAIAQRKKGEVL